MATDCYNLKLQIKWIENCFNMQLIKILIMNHLFSSQKSHQLSTEILAYYPTSAGFQMSFLSRKLLFAIILRPCEYSRNLDDKRIGTRFEYKSILISEHWSQWEKWPPFGFASNPYCMLLTMKCYQYSNTLFTQDFSKGRDKMLKSWKPDKINWLRQIRMRNEIS